jgi:two-component system sensor histidine kinase HydH
VLAWPLLRLVDVKENREPLLADNARLRDTLARSVVLMQRANQLASLGRLTASFAHEIRNPLVALRAFAQLLPARWEDAEFRRDFSHVVVSELDRVEALVREFLSVAHGSAREHGGDGANGGIVDGSPSSHASAGDAATSRADVAEIVEGVLPLVRVQAREKDVEIVFERADVAYVDAESLRLRQVVMNLVLNALDATPPGGSIVVTCGQRERRAVELCVRDSGRGIAADDLPHIFEPFFTTRKHGTGLGLAITRQIVEACGGSIRAESVPGSGATFVVELPAAADLEPSAEAHASHG